MHDPVEQQPEPTAEGVLRELIALFAPGPDTSIRSTFQDPTPWDGTRTHYLEVPLNDISPILERAERVLNPPIATHFNPHIVRGECICTCPQCCDSASLVGYGCICPECPAKLAHDALRTRWEETNRRAHGPHAMMRSGVESRSLPHLDPDDGTCLCYCEHCYTTSDGDSRCICSECDVAACGAFHLTRD